MARSRKVKTAYTGPVSYQIIPAHDRSSPSDMYDKHGNLKPRFGGQRKKRRQRKRRSSVL